MNQYHFLPIQTRDIPNVVNYMQQAFQQIAPSLQSQQNQVDAFTDQETVRFVSMVYTDPTGAVGKIMPVGAYIDNVSVVLTAFDGDVVLKIGTASDDDALGLVDNADMLQSQRVVISDSALIGTALTENTLAQYSLVGTCTQGAAQIAINCRATRS